MKKSINEESLKEKMPNILNIELNEEKVLAINLSDISSTDKEKFNEWIKNPSFDKVSNLPDSVLDIILTDSVYNDVKITKEDKKQLLKSTSGNVSIPSSVASLLLTDFEIDGNVITALDQAQFFERYEYTI